VQTDDDKCACIDIALIFVVNVVDRSLSHRFFNVILNIQPEGYKDTRLPLISLAYPRRSDSHYVAYVVYVRDNAGMQIIVIAAISFKETSDATDFSRITCSSVFALLMFSSAYSDVFSTGSPYR